MLKQTKICASEQGSTKVSSFPCFVSWHVTYGCVSVCSLINMYDFCASWEFGIKEQSLHLGSERHLPTLPFLHLLVPFNNFSERFFIYIKCRDACKSPVKDFKLHSRVLYQKVTTPLKHCPSLFPA